MNMTDRQIKLVVFDLDGTLINSHETIYFTFTHTLKELGYFPKIDKQKFIKLLGFHFNEILEGVGIKEINFDKFINIYKNHYFDYINKSEIYPGVINTLAKLKSNGFKTALLTTKLQDQAELVCAHFKLDLYFNLIMGRRNGIAHKPSAEPLKLICDELGVALENVIIVGDTELDILCGKNAGSKTCAVTYGYRTYEDLLIYQSDYVINSIDEIIQILGVN